MGRFLTGLTLGLLLALAGRVQGGGVTVIAHGNNSGVEEWIIPMAGKMAARSEYGGTETTCYRLTVSSTSGPASVTWLGGVKPNLSASGEIFIKLDWSGLDGTFQGNSTSEIAAVAVAALLDPVLIAGDTGSRALVEMPLHFVGHSRGASVVTEMARLLGAQGIWVDQVTTLDPVPLTGFPNFDAVVVNWENVLFADNHWEEIDSLALLHGERLTGAFNRKLVTLPGGNSSAHSDVHLWYHGTADLATPSTSAEEPITASMRGTWYTSAENGGATAGYHYSRLVGGDRLSELRPAGGGTDRVRDGYNSLWDLGGGLAANRDLLPANNGLWPNVITSEWSSSGSLAPGDSFDLQVRYQGGADATGSLALTVLLDPDHNPWNGNEWSVSAGSFPTTGPATVDTIDVSVPTTGLPAGTYAVAAVLSDGSRKRSLYAVDSLAIAGAFPPPEIDGATVRLEGGVMKFTVLGTPGQSVEVRASTDLKAWTTIATSELAGESWGFSDPDTALFSKRFYRTREEP